MSVYPHICCCCCLCALFEHFSNCMRILIVPSIGRRYFCSAQCWIHWDWAHERSIRFTQKQRYWLQNLNWFSIFFFSFARRLSWWENARIAAVYRNCTRSFRFGKKKITTTTKPNQTSIHARTGTHKHNSGIFGQHKEPLEFVRCSEWILKCALVRYKWAR